MPSSVRSRPRILIVEDSLVQAQMMQNYLQQHDYQVFVASTGTAAVAQLHTADLVILDVVLPDMTGFDVLAAIRERQLRAKVLMLSTLSDTPFRVRGLKSGADDYLGKPFDLTELEARVQALLRQNYNPLEMQVGQLRINKAEQTLAVEHRTIELSKQETELLWYMANSPERIFSRQELLDNVWGSNFQGGERIVDVMVVALRKKLGSKTIETIRGVGYQLHPDLVEVRS